jgi:hypothetical protein
MRKGLWAKSFHEQVDLEGFIRREEQRAETANRSLTALKPRWDRSLTMGDYSGIRYYAIVLDRSPDFLLSGFFWPSVNFCGDWICTSADEIEWTSVSVLPYDTGGTVLLAWLDQPRGHCTRFASSLDGLADGELPHAITRMVFEFFENVFMRPSWWEGLPHNVQTSLMNRAVQASSHTRSCLMDDGLRAVDWSVVQRLRLY